MAKKEECFDKDNPLNTIGLLSNKKRVVLEGGLRTKGVFKKNHEAMPLVTIITAVFNGEKHLEETIQSIIGQSYNNLEYIIIDGGSSDATLDIIQKYGHAIDYWVSEKDKGIADAFNKGILLALGSYVNFQGDGDGFIAKDSVATALKGVNVESDMFIACRIKRVSNNGEIIFISKQPKIFKKYSLLFKMALPHQGLFTHANVFKEYGLFDINNTYCMDYEHLLRAYRTFPHVILKDFAVAKWRDDGLGNNKEREILQEYAFIKKKNKICNPIILKLIGALILIKFYCKRMLKL